MEVEIGVEVNREGFLCHPNEWTEQIALMIAGVEGIEITPAHWEIIFFLRHYYQTFKHLPNLRVFIKAVAGKLGTDKGNSRYLHTLFPNSPLKSLCKIAGLPKPPSCL